MSALTEEDAKTKWCFKTAGADPDDERGRTCLASQCMAWRFTTYIPLRGFKVSENPQMLVEPDRPANVPEHWQWEPTTVDEPSGWVEPIEECNKRRFGFCGLVGQP